MSQRKMPRQAPRKIYDQNYYKAQAMLLDPWFIEKKAWLLKRFRDVGCPLPKKPFKKYLQYQAWNKKFWDRYAEMERGPEVAQARLRLTGNKEQMSAEEFYALEDFKDEFLPPVYGQTFDEILEHFGIDREDRGFGDFLKFHIFFGKNEYHTSPFQISWRRASPEEPMELLIKIYGHTKKEDFISHWDWIAHDQKHLKDFKSKNKKWETFARDIEIYSLYKRLKAAGPKRRENTAESLDTQTLLELEGRYPGLSISNIRTIVTRAQQRLGDMVKTDKASL